MSPDDSYKSLTKKILDAAGNESYAAVSESLRAVVDKLSKHRFGRIVDAANTVAEDQKKQRRNGTRTETQTLLHIDQAEAVEMNPTLIDETLRLKALQQQRSARQHAVLPDTLAQEFAQRRAAGMEQAELFEQQLIAMQQQRYRDTLTGLYNYEYMVSVLQQEVQHVVDAGHEVSMVSFDVDNLKAVNEAGGHKMGDWMLMAMTEYVQQELDTVLADETGPLAPLVAKIKNTEAVPSVIRATGGEEFLIMVPGLSSSEARQLLMAIQSNVHLKLKTDFETKFPEESAKARAYIGEQKATGKGVNEFGSFSAGVVSLEDAKAEEALATGDGSTRAGVLFENGQVNVGRLRQLADDVGETLKKQKYPDGSTGRGHTWDYESYRLIERVDHLERGLRDTKHENALLHQQVEVLTKELKQAQEALKTEREHGKIVELQEKIKAGLGS